MSIEIVLGIVAISIVAYIAFRYINRNPKDINEYIFDFIPNLFPTIGILFTFIGIAWGLLSFDISNIENSIPELLNGLKTAFFASILGVIFLIVFSIYTAWIKKKNKLQFLSDETIALNKLVELISELKNDLNSRDEANRQVKVGNVLRDIYEESRKQSQALQSFSTDLAITISAGFEQILNNEDKGVLNELKLLRKEIETLGTKLNDPATEMTQNVVSDLQDAMKDMIGEFQASVSGSTKSEMERLAALLGQAGSSLTDFPTKLQSMTDNLNENFRGLQEVVQQISKQTLYQSEQSTEQMRKQFIVTSEILKTKVGDLQVGQEVLMNKQSDNLKISDKLLSAFNTSIEKMNGLSVGITETVSKFTKVQTELNIASVQLRTMTENVNSSTNTFKEAQIKFAQHSNVFLENNSLTISEIQKSLSRAKELSADYAQKFGVIEKGLQGIFNQIQTGLNDYRDTVGESLESYLGKYTEALTKTAESLAGASAKQEDILDELTEQLSKLNLRKS